MYGQSLYTQTPGAFHMGGGFSSPYQYGDPLFGTAFGYSSHGDALMRALGSAPSTALGVGTGAALFSSLGLGGSGMQAVANTLGFGGFGLAGGIGASVLASGVAQQFKRAASQQMFAQSALNQVVGQRDQGGLLGFGASRDNATEFAKMFRELSSSAELLTGDQELKSLFAKFNDMSLFQSVRDASEVGTRFKRLAETVRDISRDLGTTMEGVLPMFRQQLTMGYTDPGEIQGAIRTAKAMTGVGVGATQETITSLQMAQSAANFAAGGDRKLGASGALKNLGTINVALEQGLLTDEDLMRSTGQIGERGAADLAQQLMQASRQVMSGDSAYGRLLSGFLGEVDEGGFTGRIDQGALNRLGRMSMAEIQAEFSKKLQGNELSFQAQMQAGMGANISSQLGAGDFSKLLDKIFEDEEAHSDEMKQLVLQNLTGMRGQTVQQLLKLQRDSSQLEATVARQTVSRAIRNRLPAVFEEQFSIGAGFSKLARNIEANTFTPLANAFGQGLGGIGRDFDNLTEDLYTGGVGGFFSSLLSGGFTGERFGPASTAGSRSALVLRGLGGMDLRSTGDSLNELATSGLLPSVLGRSERAEYNTLLGSGQFSGDLLANYFSSRGSEAQSAILNQIMNMSMQGLSDSEMVDQFVENMGNRNFFGNAALTEDFISNRGGLNALFGALLSEGGEMDEGQREIVQGLVTNIRNRGANMLTLGSGLGDAQRDLFGDNRGVLSSMLSRGTQGASVGVLAGASPLNAVGAIGGGLIGGLTGGLFGIGEGLFGGESGLLDEDDAFGGADFEEGRLQSTFLRNLAKSNPTEALTLIRNVLTKRAALSEYITARTDKRKLSVLKKYGVRNANQTYVDGVNDLVKAITGAGDGNFREGVGKTKGLLGRIADSVQGLAQKDLRDRASDVLTDTLDSRLIGIEGADDFKAGLKSIYQGKGSAETLSSLTSEGITELLDAVGLDTAEGRALSSFFEMTTSGKGGQVDIARLEKSLLSLAGTDEQAQKNIKGLAKKGDVASLMQMALASSLANIQQVDDMSPEVRSAMRLGQRSDIARIVADVGEQLSRDLTATQKSTRDFQTATVDSIKRMQNKLPQ